ncbi:MAG: DUF4198 domain-containing protein, partial [bacterium]|nr:DUF4198 domain-containing protein [bacterium]
KTILRVGGETSDSWNRRLGYPVEIVPLADPSVLTAGETLEARVLVDGKPVAGQLVYAGYEGYHALGDDGSHQEAVRTSFESRSPEAAAPLAFISTICRSTTPSAPGASDARSPSPGSNVRGRGSTIGTPPPPASDCAPRRRA